MSADWKIQKVHLQGYRGIRDLAVDFAPDVTVLVGKNGVGKSAVLDALATLFHQLFDTMSGATVPYRMFTAGDISNRESAMRCAVTFGPGSHAPENGPVLELRAEMERPSVPFHETVRFPTTSSVIVALMNEFGEDAAHELPFVVAYGMDRVDRDADHPPSARDEMLDPYVGSLSRGKGNFEIFQQWYGLREDIESEGMRFRNQGPDRQLSAVRTAIESLLPGFSKPYIRRRREGDQLVISKGNEELAVDQLSHGEKNLLALAGDLARRLAMVNQQLDKPLQGFGWIFIDEIELHLHPGWQRRVLPALRRTFPNCQLIVSTHSAQVLSEVPASSVRILERTDGEVRVSLPDASYGLDINRILEDLMDAETRPAEVRDDLKTLFGLITRGELDEARRRLAALQQTTSPHDPELVRAEALMRRREILGR